MSIHANVTVCSHNTAWERRTGAHAEVGFAGWEPICTSPDIEPLQVLSHMPGLVFLQTLTIRLRHKTILIGKRWEFLIGFVLMESLHWSRDLPPGLARRLLLRWLRPGHQWHAMEIDAPRMEPAIRFAPWAARQAVLPPA